MKIVSKFVPKCPTCGGALGGQAGKIVPPWPCLACTTAVCGACYHRHTAKCCPDLNVVRTVQA